MKWDARRVRWGDSVYTWANVGVDLGAVSAGLMPN
jgi:hypothetical protein